MARSEPSASSSGAADAGASRDNLPLMHPGEECADLAGLDEPAGPRAERCEECGAGRLLRVCLTCGHVGCCDSGEGHARAHAEASGHPLISAWKGGAFVYCYQHGYQ